MGTLRIQKAQPSDIPIIQLIANAAWRPTYGAILTEEQSQFMLDWMYSTDTLKAAMESDTQFLLATDGETIVGFAAFEVSDNQVVTLHKIYFLPDQQGKGYGRMLLDEVIAQSIAAGGSYLELNVNRSNSARSFYEKLGFELYREEDNYIGRGYWMNDYVLRKTL